MFFVRDRIVGRFLRILWFGRQWLPVWILVATVSVFPLPQGKPLPPIKESRRVLVFYEASLSYPAIALMDREIRAALESSPYQVEFYRETLEEGLLSDAVSQEDLRAAYIRKYRDHKPDLIIAEGAPSIDFMLDSRDQYFPRVPVVFCGATEEHAGYPKMGTGFTGTWMTFDPMKTVGIALQLLPRTRRVVVVGGVSSYDKVLEDIARKQLLPLDGRLDVAYLTGLTMPALLDQVSHLPSHTFVLFTELSKDASGRLFAGGTQSLPMILAVANAPVFVLADSQMGTGAIGGYLASFVDQGRIAGATALKILGGKRPQDIPSSKADNGYIFDWRALGRWGLKETDLPRGSIILNRQPTVWEAYKWYFVAAGSLLFLETILILALLWQAAKRRKAETSFRESETRFRLVANTAPVMIWMSGPDKLRNYLNQPWLEFTGRPLKEQLGNGWTESVHPQDLKSCLDTYTQSFDRREPFTMQYRLQRYKGDYRWILETGVPRFNSDGSFAGYIGSSIDVTDRKLAEEALSQMGRRLIEAHEEERRWIARELHDDINQRIAMMTIEMEQSDQQDPGFEVHELIHRLCRRLFELSKDVQSLSHRLHSSKLEYLGLAAAAKTFCQELSGQQKIQIEFSHSGIPRNIPREISLCLFRVLQEALQNAVKHSGVQHVRAELQGTAAEIHLTVSDVGVGFDQSGANSRRGLGLISMQERLQMVGGKFSVKSKPGSGTTIFAQVPLKATVERISAAG